MRALLTENGIRPKKSLGQHFLADPNTARRVATLAEVQPGDHVLEIGPGLGSLTLALLERGARVRAVELDASLARVLERVLDAAAGPASDSVDVRVGDAYTIGLAELLADSPEWSCVSNLPYNVAVPVVVRLLEAAPAVTRIVVMVQREVGERLAASPGGKEYGAVSVKVAYYAEASLLGSVPPTVFVPRPKVESMLVRLRRPDDAARFRCRRNPSSSRSSAVGSRSDARCSAARYDPLLGERATEVLECAGVAPTARAESLGLEEWAALARCAAAAA